MSQSKSLFARLRPDNFTLLLVGMVLLASLLPAREGFAHLFGQATNLAIALLFFLHGARLSRDSVMAGLTHWRLHLTIFSATYALFPILGLLISLFATGLLSPALAAGIMFLCCLPSTVQSSIAFTSIAGGNVPAAVCSASASSLIGVFLTPLLVGLLMSANGSGAVSLDSVKAIVLQLLAPFIVGQLVHPLIGTWAGRHKKLLSLVDRGSILMVVYGAFSEAVIQGLWQQLALPNLVAMIAVNLLLLAVAMVATTLGARWLGFNKADEIAIVFCGSKKSLASGVPIANILFSAQAVGMIVLPLMLFHQIQLMVCSVLAQKYAARAKASG